MGAKGILSVTRQTDNFLTAEQIALLRSGETVPTTREDGYGGRDKNLPP